MKTLLVPPPTPPLVPVVSPPSNRRKGLLQREASSRKRSLTVGSSPQHHDNPTGSAATDNSNTSPMRAAAVSDPEPPRTTGNSTTSGKSGPSGILRKADLEREMVVLVPLSVAYLDQVKIEISVTKQHSDVRYVLSVRHAALNLAWRQHRAFDEYRRLQQRLLTLLNHGHFCNADCPWMFTFLKSYFPKKPIFFPFSSARVIAARKDALERFFATMQSFLLDRANHGCAFLTTAFANELVKFVYGDTLKQHPLEQLSNVQTSSLSGGGIAGITCSGGGDSAATGSARRRALTESLISTSDEEDAGDINGIDEICQICEASLYGEAFAGKRDRASDSFFATNVDSLESASSSSPSSMDLRAPPLAAGMAAAASPTSASNASSGGGSYRRNTHYVTTLGCGHQFHDECIVPKLNETLRCPTCDHLEVT